ncbi:MAG: PQQ-dependent sugar dehydrogenase [Telluria sp.]
MIRRCLLAAALAVGAGASAQQAYPPGWGPHPQLPAPLHKLIPITNIAPASAWRNGARPVPADGLQVQAYAAGLDHPRWLYVLPNGDVLVAETNAPPKPEDAKGIKGAVMKSVMKRAGAATPSANRITLLRGLGADGAAAQRFVFLAGLHSPFGMALVGKDFYVADSDALLRFPYHEGDTSIGARGAKVADLPAGPINHHWTKNVVASPDGSKLYVSVGSNSNVAENGIDKETGRAAIWEFDRATGKGRIYASGLRNPVGMAFQPQGGSLWTSVNERDEIGNDLPPDYLTAVQDGGFYGWPYSYFGQHVDVRVAPPRPDLVARAIVPDYALGAHTASLGLAFYHGSLLPRFEGGALVGQHGSWNRTPRAGYQVVFIPFANGRPSGPPQDVLGGFLTTDGKAAGRPVGVAVGRDGAILVADDVGNTVWRITPTGGHP